MKVKKLFRKVLETVMAVIMAFGMLGTTVYAEEPIQIPDRGNLYIHRYTIQDMKYAGNANDGSVVTDLPSSSKSISDVEFKVYKIDISSAYPSSGECTVDSMSDTTIVMDSKSKTFNVSLVKTVATDKTGTAVLKELEKGVYLVVEQENEKIAIPAAPYIVAVPMTNINNDDWITEVHTYPKNSNISITKEVNQTSFDVGDIISWTITPAATSAVVDCKKYEVTDILDKSLNYISDSILIKGISDEEGETTIPKSNYSAVVNSDNKLIISFDDIARKSLPDYSYLKITFDTRVNKNILNNEAYSLSNKASLEFTNKYGQEHIIESDIVKIHTAAIKVIKTNSEGEPLQNAKFKIATSEKNAENGNYLKRDISGNIIDYGEDGYDSASDWELTSDEKGNLIFDGIKDYNIDRKYLSYYLVETKSPSGYNLMGTPVKATFTADSARESNNYTIVVNIKNDQTPSLPKTGGNETWIFRLTAFGLLGMAVGVSLYILRKKLKDRDEN